MVKIYSNIILLTVIGLAVVVSGCTGGQDVTPIVKTLPEVQQFLKEHPNAKITVTYWSKEDVAKFEEEISQQCDKPITPAAMYKATISEGDLKSIAWIDAATQTLICSTTEGKGGTPASTPSSTPVITPTPITTQISTPAPAITSTPTAVPTSGPDSIELAQGYALYLARVEGVTETRTSDGTVIYSKDGNNARISLQLIRDGKVVGGQVLTEGSNDVYIMEGERLIVKVNFRALFLGATSYMARLDKLVQYDKDTWTGKIIFTQDIVTLTKPYPSTPTATSTPFSTPTLMPSPTPTSTPPITPSDLVHVPGKKALYVGETWAIGDIIGWDTQGYYISIVSMDANANPRKVRIAFGRNGATLAEKDLAEGDRFNYNGIFFNTWVDSIYALKKIVWLKDTSMASFVPFATTPTPTGTATPVGTPPPTPTYTLVAATKDLTTDEAWNIGSGYSFSVVSIDVAGKQVWMVLVKDGVKLEDIVSIEGKTYEWHNGYNYNYYVNTKIASIYSSGGKDYVRLENTGFSS